MKKCTKCKEEKEFTEYVKDKRSSDGLYNICKPCKKKHYPCKSLPYEVRRAKHLKEKYNMTLQDYSKLSEEQKGKCKICNKEETTIHNILRTIKPLTVDHCHTTGKVRGLLCDSCNRALGYFKDNPIALRKAADYLEATNG